MDFLTQQFIAFTKKLSIQIARLNDVLQKQNEAIEKAAAACHQKQQPAPQIRAELYIPEAIENSRTKQHNQNRRLQIAVVIVSSITAIGTLGAFTAAVYYAHYARLQWKEMTKATKEATNSADAAQGQLEASQRPWIKILDVQTRGNNQIIPALSFQRSESWPQGTQQATFQLDIAFKNIGHSVAKVTVDFELFLPLWKNGYSDVILAEQKRYCDSSKINPSLSIALFPGDETFHWYGAGAGIVKPENTNYLSNRRPGVGYILPVVAVCVDYQFGDSPKTYQTSALYEVFRKDDRTRFFEAGVGVPARKIFLIRNQYADAAY